MGNYFKQSLDTVLAFGGNGLLLLYFLASVVFLLVTEKEKGIRKLMAEYPIAILLIFFIPLFPYLVCTVFHEQETFYRFLWLIPMSAVSAYATICFLEKIKIKWLKIVLGAFAMVCVAIGGNPGYQSPVMIPATNAYQIPEQVIELCDAMNVPGREVEAVFPHELVPYVRQYTPYIKMPYGYETLVARWGFTDDLEYEMLNDVSNTENLTNLARERGCHYIVLNKNHYVDKDLTEYGFEYFYETEGYIVYVDSSNVPKC